MSQTSLEKEKGFQLLVKHTKATLSISYTAHSYSSAPMSLVLLKVSSCLKGTAETNNQQEILWKNIRSKDESQEDASGRIWVVFSINSPTISVGHAQHCTFSTSLPIHYPPCLHVLFRPLCIPQLSQGANLLVEAFWLHLPFKSYRLKLVISSLSCSSIAWDPWDCLPSALLSTGAQFTFPPLKILLVS